jgi:hypothetical protein
MQKSKRLFDDLISGIVDFKKYIISKQLLSTMALM